MIPTGAFVKRGWNRGMDDILTPAACSPGKPPSLRLVLGIRRTARRGKVFLLDFLGVEFRRALAHGLQDFLERRRLALDPAHAVDARLDAGAKVRTDEAAGLQLPDELAVP